MVDEEKNSWEEGEDFKIVFEKGYGLRATTMWIGGFFGSCIREERV